MSSLLLYDSKKVYFDWFGITAPDPAQALYEDEEKLPHNGKKPRERQFKERSPLLRRLGGLQKRQVMERPVFVKKVQLDVMSIRSSCQRERSSSYFITFVTLWQMVWI